MTTVDLTPVEKQAQFRQNRQNLNLPSRKAGKCLPYFLIITINFGRYNLNEFSIFKSNPLSARFKTISANIDCQP
jgi:hypothetical protein